MHADLRHVLPHRRAGLPVRSDRGAQPVQHRERLRGREFERRGTVGELDDAVAERSLRAHAHALERRLGVEGDAAGRAAGIGADARARADLAAGRLVEGKEHAKPLARDAVQSDGRVPRGLRALGRRGPLRARRQRRDRDRRGPRACGRQLRVERHVRARRPRPRVERHVGLRDGVRDRQVADRRGDVAHRRRRDAHVDGRGRGQRELPRGCAHERDGIRPHLDLRGRAEHGTALAREAAHERRRHACGGAERGRDRARGDGGLDRDAVARVTRDRGLERAIEHGAVEARLDGVRGGTHGRQHVRGRRDEPRDDGVADVGHAQGQREPRGFERLRREVPERGRARADRGRGRRRRSVGRGAQRDLERRVGSEGVGAHVDGRSVDPCDGRGCVGRRAKRHARARGDRGALEAGGHADARKVERAGGARRGRRALDARADRERRVHVHAPVREQRGPDGRHR